MSLLRRTASRASALIDVIRPGAIDESTAEGRATGRVRRMLWSIGATSGARVVSMATGFIAVPLTLNYLGPERNGLLNVITNLSMALNFADLGLGNSLITTVAEAHGRGDREAERQQVSTAFFLFLAIATILLLAFAVTYPLVSWPRFFNTESALAAREVGPALVCYVAALAVGLVAAIVTRIELAHQNGFINGLWQAGASVASLLALVACRYWQLGLPSLVFALTGIPAIGTVVQGVVLFARRRPDLRPSFASVHAKVARELLRLGSGYVVLQLATAVSLYSDGLLTTRFLGPTTLNQYAIVQKPFGLLFTMLFMALVPLWPAFTEALTKEDFGWVRRTLKRALMMAFVVTGVPAAALIVVGPILIPLWARRPTFEVPVGLLIPLAVWTLIQGIGVVWSSLLNAMRLVRVQAMLAIITAAVALAAKIYFVRIDGTPGLVWGTAITYLLLNVIPAGLYLRHSLRQRMAAAR